MQYSSRQSAFTLLEVLVVLGLIAVLAAVLLPRMMSGQDHYLLSRNVRNVASAMRSTRAMAIADQTEKVIVFNLDDKTYQVDGERHKDIDEDIAVQVFTATTEVSDDGRLAGVRFYPDGASTGGRVTLSLDDDVRALDVVWMTGQINILDNPTEDQ